jgi:hypothetical protein
MDYQYENLGPEHFQELCQSLLVKEFPKTQCLPVGQPDGGRDAIVLPLLFYTKDVEFMVFQVKYVRDPHAVSEPHKWLTGILKEEAPKINKLIPKGAKQYYILTNIRGTSHLDVGSIDSVQKVLNDAIDIPAQCWWRDDLNRRIDNAFDLKWSHPEILTGPDMIRQVIETGLTEDRQRRTSAMRTFIRNQYEREKEVRFKQVELQNNLFDLFIDVPIVTPDYSATRKGLRSYRRIKTEYERQKAFERHHIVYQLKDTGEARATLKGDEVGAAAMLLNRKLNVNVPFVVIEGAPGQGKSTIVQYVCQIHRSRVLGEELNENLIPEQYRKNPVKLPIKMDLRDFAIWLSGKNPFIPDDTSRPKEWDKSLESFLTALIRTNSGGANFSVSDLHAVTNLSSILLVLDGFDEIPSVSRRNMVVDEITSGVHRLNEISASLQVIVTSRPAAFASAPGLPEELFSYFELGSVTKPLINEYAEKWLKAKNLKGKEAKEIRGILDQKLDQPHLRELARNPMQLAILLSLIHTRGSSLPEKRTALYDSYVELFFNREAEKSTVVRDHRELLIDIHRYVAWIMHSQAEMTDSPGSITTAKLQKLIDNYLAIEQHDTSIGSKLFTGMVERIVALVSRVEGTFEFEVQPLREYFAARYLYDTAPYSPPGAEKCGTLLDRFDAIARNSFWLNVTRFYGGCFSKGQLAALVDRLEELSRLDGYKFTSIAQELSGILLSDWVFSQHPRSMLKVIKIISNPITLRRTLSWTGRPRGKSSPLTLTEGCGNEQLALDCLHILESFPQSDFTGSLVELIASNLHKDKIGEYWLNKLKRFSRSKQTKWIQCGAKWNCLSEQSSTDIDSILSDIPIDENIMHALLLSGHEKYFEENENRFNTFVECILERKINVPHIQEPSTVLEGLSEALNAENYAYVSQFPGRFPMNRAMLHPYRYDPDSGASSLNIEAINNVPTYEFAIRSFEIVKTAFKEREHQCKKWASSLEPWNNIVEKGRSKFGERWSFFHMANMAAGIKSNIETCKDSSLIFDKGVPLCSRARFARLRCRNTHWWSSQLYSANNDLEVMFSLLICLTWASPKTLVKLLDKINMMLKKLNQEGWNRLYSSLRQAVKVRNNNSSSLFSFEMRTLPKELSARTVVSLSVRGEPQFTQKLFSTYLQGYNGSDKAVLNHCQRIIYKLIQKNPTATTWDRNLPEIARFYSKGVMHVPRFLYSLLERGERMEIPQRTAEKIMEEAEKYPIPLINAAEMSCRRRISSKSTPVAKIAQRDKWFLSE